MTLISAPAGFGKTSLASEWVSGCGRAVAWLSLDERDGEPTRFLAYLIAALQTATPKVGEGMVVALQSPQPPAVEPLVTGLLNEIAQVPDPFVLVLDDYHAIDSPAVDRILAYVIEHQPHQMHLAVITREDPSLSQARLRARDQMTELRVADLRFKSAEAAEFFTRVMCLGLSESQIATLEERTEGWIAGMQLAAVSMQGREDTAAFIDSFTGSHRFVLDYLLEEVLHRQSPAIQAFLLRTSVLERLCGPLCDAVLGAPSGFGQETLTALERANLFLVPLDEDRLWYRYHHLFGELLRKRLGTPDELSDYHVRACRWYEDHEMIFDAFLHAIAANDIERAERLLTSGKLQLHSRSVIRTVLDSLASVDPRVLDAHPRLRVRAATLPLMAGQTDGVEARIQAAERSLPDTETDESSRDLHGQLACARATLALTRYDPAKMIAEAERALEFLDPTNLAFRFTANWALASASLLQGDRLTAARACREGITISEQSGDRFSIILATGDMGHIQELNTELVDAAETYGRAIELAGAHPQPSVGEVHLGLARIYYEWNNLQGAEEHGTRSLELTRRYGRLIDRSIVGEVFLARLELARDQADRAGEMLARTERTALNKGFTERLSEIAAVQVLVMLCQGQPSAAAALAQRFELPLSRARILLHQDQPEAALEVLRPFREQMEARGWKDEHLRALIVEAVALHRNGEASLAQRTLAVALAAAEPGRYARSFLDEGEALRSLLSDFRLQNEGQDRIHGARIRSYVDALLAAFPRGTNDRGPRPGDSARDPRPGSIAEPLSPRELETLRLIAAGLSNQEIGERLYMALDTVKGHNRRIFDKLQVRRRTEAVARARELGLL